MSMFLGPLDAAGCVPAGQQTRIAAFLLSCHGAMARQLALAITWQMHPAWHAELNAQLFHEAEIVTLLLRTTSWTPDPELLFLLPSWEAAWLPKVTESIADRTQALTIDIAALGHALHSVIRPAALLPEGPPSLDPFALALRRIEFESGRVMQAQSMFLKSADLLPLRQAVTQAVERRHLQVRKLWLEMLAGIDVDRCKSQ
jgi:hypothetical protein